MHPIENILQTTMNEIKQMIDVNTIVGDAITTPSGSTIIPISKVSFGFVSGGGEYPPANKERLEEYSKFPFSGGSGSGISIRPVAFLVVDGENVKMLCTNHKNPWDKVLECVPQVITEISNIVKEKCGSNSGQNSAQQNQNAYQTQGNSTMNS